jgi:predicted ATP-binding protein involved in virulence
MIKIDKGNIPEYLQSESLDLAMEKLNEFYSKKNRNQKRYDFPFNSNVDGPLKPILHKEFHGKCGYCETKIELPQDGVIDRFRPHNGVRDTKDYFPDLYWWLVYEWGNLIYSCKECNQYKANYFPIKGKRAEGNSDDLRSEKKLLLNPYEDNPRDHLSYDDFGNIHSITEEGYQTIELLRLDRTDLLEKRKVERDRIVEIIEKIIQDGINSVRKPQLNYLKNIYNEDNKSIQFLAFKRWVLIKELESNPFLGQILDLEDNEQDRDWVEKVRIPTKEKFSKKDFLVSDYFPIEYIHIKNFKSIDDLKIEFKEDELDKKSWLFLLGENGVGKSSILQAIAIGLKLDKKLINEDTVQSLIKKRKQSSEITIKERNSKNIIYTKLVRKTNSIEQTGKFNSYLIGYGSLRLSVDEIESNSSKDISNISYENLFKPIKALNDVTKWLRSIHKNDIDFFDRIAISIKQLLPHDKSDTNLSIKNGEIVLGDSETLYAELSDGYKSTITLAIDIMMKLSDAQSDMKVMSGIVLIDELGNQLHPRWQMRIVNQLREVFPRITFIVSTHHPLCLRGSHLGEVVLLRNVKNEVEAIRELPDPTSLRVDQLLSSEYFGLSSLIDPELEAKFNRYYQLLSIQKNITATELKELNTLKDELRNKKHLGSSLREELMYTVIDNLLAQKVMFSKEIPNRESLKKEVVERVKEIWLSLNIETND